MGIDWKRVEAEIMVRAEVGLRNAAEFTLGRAKHHAPVRAVFKRDRRGKSFRHKGGIKTESAYRAFLASKERRKRVDVGRFNRPSEREITASNVPTKHGGTRNISGKVTVGGDLETPYLGATEQSGGVIRRGRRLGRATSFSGHANSLVPVVRQGGYKITGDLRSVSPVPDIVRQKRGQSSRPLRAESLEQHRGAYYKGGSKPNIDSFRNSMLSSRGRYEFKHAKKRGLFEGRVGGRLRGEIRLGRPRLIGKTLWMYVESPTPYAPYQEFGTSRNRAQPFLRPALYESRQTLRSEVRKVATGKTLTRGASSGVTPGQPGPGVD